MAKAYCTSSIKIGHGKVRPEPDEDGEYQCLAWKAEDTAKCTNKWHMTLPRGRTCPGCNALGIENT